MKRSSTSDQPTSKRQLQGFDEIEERRRAREAQTKELAEKERMQLVELQKKTKEVISAVKNGTTIQIESYVDSSVQSTKEYGSPSGTKPSGESLFISLSPSNPKGNSLFQEDIFPEPKDDSQKILGNSIKEMNNRGDSKEKFATIYINGKEIKVYVTHTLFHETKNEELRRMRLSSLEEQAELIADETDIMERLKAQAEDEALAINLQEEVEKGIKKKKGGKKRGCSSSRGRRIKRRAGRDESKNEEEEAGLQDQNPEVSAHQNVQPKEEPQDLGEPEQATRSVHPFSNRIIMPKRSLSTELKKEAQIKAAEEKPTPLKMDKVIACKGIRMNRPGPRRN